MDIYSMASQPHNPKFKTNPENFHPCDFQVTLVSFFFEFCHIS